MTRITGTTRGPAMRFVVDGAPVDAFAGETVATAMLASGRLRFGGPDESRGLLCNMGTCSGCLVTLVTDARRTRTRACLLRVADGMRIETAGAS